METISILRYQPMERYVCTYSDMALDCVQCLCRNSLLLTKDTSVIVVGAINIRMHYNIIVVYIV